MSPTGLVGAVCFIRTTYVIGLPKKPLLAGSIERFTGSFGEAHPL